MKLYHYVHCPFCVRVRMACGHLNIPFQSNVLPYNDEETPLSLTGVKMLPITEIDGTPMNESLDIIEKIDTDNTFHMAELKKEYASLEELLDRIGRDVHSLAMPYWIWTPEFNEQSRKYFQNKKEKKRGPFKDLVHNKNKFITNLNETLAIIETKLTPYFENEVFSIKDILIAAHLWGMYVVPEFQFSVKMHHYLQDVARICHFNYHEDFWR